MNSKWIASYFYSLFRFRNAWNVVFSAEPQSVDGTFSPFQIRPHLFQCVQYFCRPCALDWSWQRYFWDYGCYTYPSVNICCPSVLLWEAHSFPFWRKWWWSRSALWSASPYKRHTYCGLCRIDWFMGWRSYYQVTGWIKVDTVPKRIDYVGLAKTVHSAADRTSAMRSDSPEWR